jgi:dihydropteroate synthase
MGIINLTPDSFYSESRYSDQTSVLKRVDEILTQGGSMVDLGAYSSRPGSVHITEEEEIARLMPFLESIRKHFPDLIISIDTFRSQVAFKAVNEFEADVINDISGGEMDDLMVETIAKIKVPYVLMHMQGTPQTMQKSPNYKDVVGEVLLSLAQKVDTLRSKGINDLIIDPGFGFGKTLDQNFQLLNNLDQFKLFELPILVGMSRKSMIYNTLDGSPDDSLNGTTVLNTMALDKGANILRVHDVKEAVECVKLVEATKGVFRKHQ